MSMGGFEHRPGIPSKALLPLSQHDACEINIIYSYIYYIFNITCPTSDQTSELLTQYPDRVNHQASFNNTRLH